MEEGDHSEEREDLEIFTNVLRNRFYNVNRIHVLFILIIVKLFSLVIGKVYLKEKVK